MNRRHLFTRFFSLLGLIAVGVVGDKLLGKPDTPELEPHEYDRPHPKNGPAEFEKNDGGLVFPYSHYRIHQKHNGVVDLKEDPTLLLMLEAGTTNTIGIVQVINGRMVSRLSFDDVVLMPRDPFDPKTPKTLTGKRIADVYHSFPFVLPPEFQ